jgi:uncharacterized membrane protein YdbT with pleckstrin-like domain
MKATKYRSSISLGLVAFLALVFGSTSALMIRDCAWLGLVINGSVILGIVVLFKTTTYVLSDEGLEIRCGLSRQFIRWKDIHSVKYTSNPISAPAFSFKRIQISHGKMGCVLISPHTRESFMNELHKRQSFAPMS